MSKKRSQSNVEKTYVRIRPRILTKPLLNPHKGIATFQHFNGEAGYPSWYNWNESGPTEFAKFKGRLKNTKYPQTTVSYCRWYWKVLEPEKRKYRWDIIDGALKAGRERGQTLHIRVMPHSGSPVRMGGDTSVPDWYEDSGPKEPGGSWFREREGLPGFKERGLRVPCYNSQRYLKDWGDFIRAFGKRYDGHENLDCFEIAFIGAWGEGDGKITKPQIERIVDVYKKAFKKTHLITMSRAHQFEYAVGLGAGWRADSLGDLGLYAGPERLSNIKGPGWSHMYDEYIKYVATSREKRIWEKAPVVFEPSTTIIQWVRDGYDINWIIEQALKWRLGSGTIRNTF